jgi:hypothetical protein
MKTVISASRRTDLVAHFSGWFAAALRARTARVAGPSGRVLDVDLAPEGVHTVVLWSKDFANLLRDKEGLRGLLATYDQVYCHFTITGLGGTAAEPGTPRPEEALAQIPELTAFAGRPERVTMRFDPILFWDEGGGVRSNLAFFDRLAAAAAAAGIRDIRTSFAQWYRKARRRAESRAFPFVDPTPEQRMETALALTRKAAAHGLTLHACSQTFLAETPGFRASSCIDGRRLRELHPRGEAVSEKKDRTQRAECLCTASRDIGSYTQACPHGCVYCYANPTV